MGTKFMADHMIGFTTYYDESNDFVSDALTIFLIKLKYICK